MVKFVNVNVMIFVERRLLTRAKNRMVWIITGFVPGKYSYIRRTCITGAKILGLVDAETGDSLGSFVHCPSGNGRSNPTPA